MKSPVRVAQGLGASDHSRGHALGPLLHTESEAEPFIPTRIGAVSDQAIILNCGEHLAIRWLVHHSDEAKAHVLELLLGHPRPDDAGIFRCQFEEVPFTGVGSDLLAGPIFYDPKRSWQNDHLLADARPESIGEHILEECFCRLADHVPSPKRLEPLVARHGDGAEVSPNDVAINRPVTHGGCYNPFAGVHAPYGFGGILDLHRLHNVGQHGVQEARRDVLDNEGFLSHDSSALITQF